MSKSKFPEPSFKLIWRTASAPDSTAHAIYAVLKGINGKQNDKLLVAGKVLNSTFTPITNGVKLRSGTIPFQAMHHALAKASQLAVGVLSSRSAVVASGSKISDGVAMLNTLPNEDLGVFITVVSELISDSMKSRPKYFDPIPKHFVYAFVRSDLSPEQVVVQVGHAMATLSMTMATEVILERESCIRRLWQKSAADGTSVKVSVEEQYVSSWPDVQCADCHLAVIGVSQDELRRLQDSGIGIPSSIKTVTWSEPAVGVTALATMPIRGRKRRRFDSFQTLRFAGIQPGLTSRDVAVPAKEVA